MKHYIFLISEILIGTAVFTLASLNIFPAECLQFILIATCIIAGLDIINDAISAIINLDLLNIRIYIVIAAIVFIATSHPHETLLCIIIIQVTGILSGLIEAYLKLYPENFIKKLLSKEVLLQTEEGTASVEIQTLNQGDIISISCGEIVPLDCILLEATATFESASMFATSIASTLYEGDEVQGGLRMTSSGSIRLKVACPPDESTFVRYANTYLSSVACIFKLNKICPPGYFVNALTVCFKKGILVSTPDKLDKLFNSKLAIFTKEAILNTKKYRLTGIYPKNDTINEAKLLKYAVCAELPYDNSYIGHAILTADKSFSFLSDVKQTTRYPGMGVKTITGNDTILAGNKQLMISQNIKGLPVFDKFEDGMSITDTYIYIAVNDRYMGYLHLTAPIRENLADIMRFLYKKKIHAVLMTEDNCSFDSVYGLTHKKHRFKEIYTNQTADKKQSNLLTLKQKYKFKKNDSILYFDKGQSDIVLTSMCDYHVIMGPVLLNQDISFADTSILSGSCYKFFIEGFSLLNKARKAINMHIFIIILFKFLVLISAICFPEVYFWHAVAADCLMYLLINTLSVLPKYI